MQALRPLDVGELLDAGLAVYRRHFGLFVRIAAVGYGVPTVVQVYVALGGGALAHPVAYVFAMLLQGIGGIVVAAATMQAIADAYLGETPSLGVALRTAKERFWKVLGANIVRWVVIVLPVAVVGGVAAVLIGAAGQADAALAAAGLVVGVGFIAAMVVSVILMCGLSVVTQVAVLEHDLPHAAASIRRSWRLTSAFKGRAFLIGIVVWLLFYLPVVLAASAAAVLEFAQAWVEVLGFIVSALLAPIVACVFTLFYYDLRVRKEGFDLEVLSRQMGLEPPAA